MPLTFSGGNLITLNVQIIEKRPFEFDITEAHDDTEEVVGSFDVETVLLPESIIKEIDKIMKRSMEYRCLK